LGLMPAETSARRAGAVLAVAKKDRPGADADIRRYRVHKECIFTALETGAAATS